MIQREAWYRETSEKDIQVLLERVKRNDLDAVIEYYRIMDRLGDPGTRETVLDLYEMAHPGRGYGHVGVAKENLEGQLEKSWWREIEEATESKVQETVSHLVRAKRELDLLYHMNRGRRMWERGFRQSWEGAERHTQEAVEAYRKLTEEEREIVGWDPWIERWFL